MIKINLLPPQLRKQKTQTPRLPYIPVALLGAGLFFILTFFFYADFIRARSSYERLRQDWLRIGPTLSQLKAMENKVEIEMRGEKEFLEKYVLNTNSMTHLLESTSKFLPQRGWLTEFKAERDGEGCRLILQGVVLASPSMTGIEQIEEYLNKLKADLSPKTTLTLTTSKDSKKDEGTVFTANFAWGMTQKNEIV